MVLVFFFFLNVYFVFYIFNFVLKSIFLCLDFSVVFIFIRLFLFLDEMNFINPMKGNFDVTDKIRQQTQHEQSMKRHKQYTVYKQPKGSRSLRPGSVI